MKKNYYTVGQMAKIANVSNQTLRYYDQIGLFKPEYIDEQSNYRYYAESQLYLLDLIKSLRFVGTPLEKIKEVQHFTIEEMIHFLDEQENTIEQQLMKLQEAKYTLRKTRKHMEEQLAIPVMNEVFEKQQEEERLLCLQVKNSTPEYVSNEEMLKLTETIENTGSVQTIRYGGIFSLDDYETMDDIKYSDIFIPILTSKEINILDDKIKVTSLKAGTYLEIAFVYSRDIYLDMYRKLSNYILENNLRVEPKVWEFIMPTNFSPNLEEQLIVELKVKLI